MEEKFIKAYCEKANQYYGLRVEVDGGVPRVVDFYSIEPDLAKRLGSNIDATDLQTADNLRSCFVCGRRGVRGCACAEPLYHCARGQGYRYQCVYCEHLRVFGVDEGAEVESGDAQGSTVQLEQGQEVVISAVGSGALESILVGVGWDIAKSGKSMDVDSSVFVNEENGHTELVYFGHKEHSSGCVVHHGDNLVGGKYSNNSGTLDSENIDVFLPRVPSICSSLYFVLNIYHCDQRRQTLKDVLNMYIRLTNGKTGRVLLEYRMKPEMCDMTGIVIGKAYRVGSQWKFKAIGKAVRVSDVDSLYEYCNE